MSPDFLNIGHRVLFILKHSPESKDDDRILLSVIWKNELKEGQNILESLKDGTISNPETVTRIRRKLQEKYPDLRGEKWLARHSMEAVVCQQLTFFDNWVS